MLLDPLLCFAAGTLNYTKVFTVAMAQISSLSSNESINVGSNLQEKI